jgi:uncharacterized protein
VVVAALVAVAMAAGLAGIVVPGIPGVPLVWGAALAYGLATGFGAVGTAAFVVITALAVAGTVAGVVVPGRAAAAARAARSSLALAVVAGIVGFFVVPVVGFPLGAVAGLYAGERARTGDPSAAWAATRATVAGFGKAALIQLAAGLLMVATWLVWVVVD